MRRTTRTGTHLPHDDDFPHVFGVVETFAGVNQECWAPLVVGVVAALRRERVPHRPVEYTKWHTWTTHTSCGGWGGFGGDGVHCENEDPVPFHHDSPPFLVPLPEPSRMDSVVVVVDWCVPPRNHRRHYCHYHHHDDVDEGDGWRQQPDGFVEEVGLPATVVPPEADETYGCGTTWVEDRLAQP